MPAADPSASHWSARTSVIVGLGLAGSLAILVATFVPWRADELSDPQSLLRVSRRAPQVLVGQLIATVAVIAATLIGVVRPRRSAVVVLALAALGVVFALAAFLALPLPTGHAIGSTPDGRMIEFDLPSHRSWGCYLSLGGSVLCFVSAALRKRSISFVR